MNRLSLLFAPLLFTACASEIYEVGLESTEVTRATFQLSVDRAASTVTVRLGLSDLTGTDNSCPALANGIELALLADGEEVPVEVISRGGGDVGVDCAFKCRELVAFAASCTPAIVEVSGPDAATIVDARELTFELREGAVVLSQAVGDDALEARHLGFPEGNTIVLRPDEIDPERGTGTTPVEWSHPEDESLWASEWRDGSRFDGDQLSAFLFTSSEAEPLLLRATGLSEGEHTVFVGSSVPVPACSFHACHVSHVESASVSVEHR